MSYQVLARKWRPRTFDEVVGQRGATETLRNALASGRLAQAFVFAGARGVGKTTTARILAKALNCVHGPTPSPCGACDMCVEIAEGRDLDVLEIDAATNTQVDKVRETIIEGLALRPVRDRYKVFIIDEVHQLSSHSFNALLKSIEEPPPHVVFIMATTELHKIPDTITSRSQVYEFRTISTKAITAQLRKIADAEGLDVEAAALSLLARAAEGSLRDAESAFDQVIAFSGGRITADDVSSVLGLVGRDVLMDIVQTVAEEDAPRVFDHAARVVESGQDLRVLLRELARLVRDMMVLAIDPARADDPEFTPEGDVERLRALAGRFSREDLLRAFDLLSRAEFEVRNSPHPRYHLEMALLRWVHLRQLVPLADLLAALERGDGSPLAARPTRGPASSPTSRQASRAAQPGPSSATSTADQVRRLQETLAARGTGRAATPPPAATGDSGAAGTSPPAEGAGGAPKARADASARRAEAHESTAAGPGAGTGAGVPGQSQDGAPPGPGATDWKERFLDEARKSKRLLFNTSLAQAQRVELVPGRLTLAFTPLQKVPRAQAEDNRAWLEAAAAAVTGGPVTLELAEAEAPPPSPAKPAVDEAKQQLRQRALAEPVVQTMLDVFTAEIRDVEEIDT
ncbi:MAG: DNA polymerase III subunit gamma/tau [Vicinamibacterales bacterium]|nr:DNA polymerase III subunit gamma/tau [Vicinamibacterales bacterium]